MMSSTTLPPGIPETSVRRSPTMSKGLHSVRKRKGHLNTDSLHLSYADLVKESLHHNYATLVKEKDSCSILGNPYQPFAEPCEQPIIFTGAVNLPKSPSSSLSSASTTGEPISPTTPQFYKENEPLVVQCSNLDVPLLVPKHRKSDSTISLVPSLDSSINDYRDAPRSVSPPRTTCAHEQRPIRRRRDSDSGLDVAMFHQRLGRRNDHRRSSSPLIVVVPRKSSLTSEVKPSTLATVTPVQPSPPPKSSPGGFELSKPLPPHPTREPISPYDTSSHATAERQKDTPLSTPIVPSPENLRAPPRHLQHMSETPPERCQSPAPSISLSLTRWRLKRMASKAVFAKKPSPDTLEPWAASPHQDRYNDNEPLIGHGLTVSPVSPAWRGGRDGDEWDASELRSGTPMPRRDVIPHEADDAQRVRVVMAMGNRWQERNVDEVLSTLRMLKDPTKFGRAH